MKYNYKEMNKEELLAVIADFETPFTPQHKLGAYFELVTLIKNKIHEVDEFIELGFWQGEFTESNLHYFILGKVWNKTWPYVIANVFENKYQHPETIRDYTDQLEQLILDQIEEIELAK